VTRAHDRDTSWHQDANCRGKSNNPESPWYNAWFTEPKTRHKFGDIWVMGEQLIQVALDLCMHCPVQWQCASWALAVDEPQGTWGMRFEDLHWLKKQKDPQYIIAVANDHSEPVQVVVKALRRRSMS
jgi:hypothetical protein